MGVARSDAKRGADRTFDRPPAAPGVQGLSRWNKNRCNGYQRESAIKYRRTPLVCHTVSDAHAAAAHVQYTWFMMDEFLSLSWLFAALGSRKFCWHGCLQAPPFLLLLDTFVRIQDDARPAARVQDQDRVLEVA